MSENKVSDKAAEELDVGPVYDFFYYDARRVGSFLGQLDDSGLLQGVKQADSLIKARKPGQKFSAGISLPFVGPTGDASEGKLTYEREAAESGSEANERTYDPFWLNARNFLDFIRSEGKIIVDLASARMGNFIFIKGSLTVLDFGTVKFIWTNPKTRELLINNRKMHAATEGAIGTVDKKAGETQASNTRLVIDLLSQMPHAVHAHIKSEEDQVWGALNPEQMIVSSQDVLLTHGTAVPGEWQMIGILDATPDEGDLPEVAPLEQLNTEPVEGFRKAVAGLADLTRKMLGRPKNAYGVTPLLIFREVSS